MTGELSIFVGLRTSAGVVFGRPSIVLTSSILSLYSVRRVRKKKAAAAGTTTTMRIVVENRVKLSSAESMEIAIPHFDTVESGTKQSCTFEAGGVSWQVKVKVGPNVSVLIGYYRLPYKDIYTRFGDDNGEKGTDERIFKHNQYFTPIHAVALSEVLDPKRTFLDQDKSLRIFLLVRNKIWFQEPPPGNPILMQMQDEDQYMDAAFLVDGETFLAHKCVLQMGCRLLWELVRDATEPVELPDVQSHHFDQIMNWIYRNEFIGDFCSPEDAQDMLTAANKFGFTLLKLNIEAVIANIWLDVPSAAELMVWAHNNCCPLLQEAAMELYLLAPKDVGQSEGWKMVKDCPALMEELLEMSVHERLGSKRMSVTALWEHLLRIGLFESIDGSRAMMIKALADRGVWVA
jgi:BTB/POZ domain